MLKLRVLLVLRMNKGIAFLRIMRKPLSGIGRLRSRRIRQLSGFLAGLIFFGNGVIKDYIQAYAWWNICAANGMTAGKEKKQEVAEEMTKEQIAEAQQLSTEMIRANPKLIN